MITKPIVAKIRRYFPKFSIKYKDQSILMKIIGWFLFCSFNQFFMKEEATSLSQTIYFPNSSFIKRKPLTSIVFLCYELVHIHNKQRLFPGVYCLSYLFPQVLLPFLLPLFLISWKLALPLMILFLLPLPAYFRMQYEKQAYLASLYCMHTLNQKYDYHIDISGQLEVFVEQFSSRHYYWMFPFQSIKRDFDKALLLIKAGEKPYQDEIFVILDDILQEI